MKVQFTKTIKSGNILEIYQYERAPHVSAAGRRPRVEKNADDKRHSAPQSRRIDNVMRAKRRFIRLVRANTAGDSKPAFLTLTMYSVTSLETASRIFGRFTERLKTANENPLRYFGVPEFQKRGAVHFHCLVWGLRDGLVENERDTRYLQNIWGYGYVDIIATDGSDKLAGYLAKYMSKGLLDVRLAGKRGYYCSSSVLRPLHFKTTQIANHTDLIWGVDKTLVHESRFMTEWLGEGRYYRYNLTPSVT